MSVNDLLLWYARSGITEFLRKSAFRKFCRRNKGVNFVSRTRDGFKMNLEIGDSVDNAIYVHGLFEPTTSRVIGQLAPRTDCLIDVGCNIGYFSCLYSARNPSGKLYSIDPNPLMIERCKANLELNDASKNLLFNLGIAAQKGRLSLNIPRSRHSLASFAYIPRSNKPDDTDSIEVDVMPLHDLLAEQEITRALLKIDTEGFEYEVLASLTEKDVDKIDYLIFEVSYLNLEQAGTNSEALFSLPWLTQFDSYVVDDKQNRITPVGYEALINDRQINNNILLIKKGYEFDLFSG